MLIGLGEVKTRFGFVVTRSKVNVETVTFVKNVKRLLLNIVFFFAYILFIFHMLSVHNGKWPN